MIHTTFAKAKEKHACRESYLKMATALGGVYYYGKDTPIPLDRVLEVCGLPDALWCLQATIEPVEKESRLLACDFAEHVLHIYEGRYPDDKRPRYAIEVSRRFAEGNATSEELRVARNAAWDATEDLAWDATWTAAGDAAGAAARRVAWDAAWDAERTAAWATVRAAEKTWQEGRFLEMQKGFSE